MRRLSLPGGIALLALIPIACEQGIPTEPSSPSFIINPDGSATPSPEEVDLCKVGPDGSFNFSVSATTATLTAGPSPDVAAGTCIRIARKGAAADEITVTENVPAGFVLDQIVVEQLGPGGVVTTTVITDGNTATATVSGHGPHGAVITFYNSVEPPPPGGGEGCTPGYWKQEHHFDSWPAPYTPSTLFNDVFAGGFPGKTLVEVAAQGGGGIKALGRHTVAALLNAASGGVSYDLTTADVIDAFNAALLSGDYEDLKDVFEDFNEQGCPLN